MIENQGALTVADLCSDHSTVTDNNHDIDDADDSTMGFVDEVDDDSFLANNSLCKEHRSTIQMLESLRKEVVEMVRSDDKYGTPMKSPQDVTIDLNMKTDLSSPLTSPILSRTIASMSNKNMTMPVLSNNRITPQNINNGYLRHGTNSDDSTFCSMDNSINNDINLLKEVVKDLERELKAENLNTVFEAIERIGNSDDPRLKGVLESEDRDVIRDGIRSELFKEELSHEPTFFWFHPSDIIGLLWGDEVFSMNVSVLIASIVAGLFYRYISS